MHGIIHMPIHEENNDFRNCQWLIKNWISACFTEILKPNETIRDKITEMWLNFCFTKQFTYIIKIMIYEILYEGIIIKISFVWYFIYTICIHPNQKFIVVATSKIIGIHRSSVYLRRRPSSAFQSFPFIFNAGSVAFPMLALVGNARDSVL